MNKQSEKKLIIGNDRTEEKETPERLLFMMTAYTRQKSISESNKVRLTDMMQRKKAKKWDAEKKQKMVRRLMSADQMINECNDALDQLAHRLSQITTVATPKNAPSVPFEMDQTFGTTET